MSGTHVPAPDNNRRLDMAQRNRAKATRRRNHEVRATTDAAGGGHRAAEAGATLTGAPAFAAAPLLKSNLNGRCADIFMFHQENGASTVTWDCHGGTNQQWRWDGEQIRSSMNGKCLEIYGPHLGDQGSVAMWD